jgi:hypothetical protein
VPEEAPGAAEPVAGAAVVTLCVGGCAVTLGLPETVAVRLGRLPIELVMLLPHPAASNPAARTAATRESLAAERRMLILPQVFTARRPSLRRRRHGCLRGWSLYLWRMPGRPGRVAS